MKGPFVERRFCSFQSPSLTRRAELLPPRLRPRSTRLSFWQKKDSQAATAQAPPPKSPAEFFEDMPTQVRQSLVPEQVELGQQSRESDGLLYIPSKKISIFKSSLSNNDVRLEKAAPDHSFLEDSFFQSFPRSREVLKSKLTPAPPAQAPTVARRPARKRNFTDRARIVDGARWQAVFGGLCFVNQSFHYNYQLMRQEQNEDGRLKGKCGLEQQSRECRFVERREPQRLRSQQSRRLCSKRSSARSEQVWFSSDAVVKQRAD